MDSSAVPTEDLPWPRRMAPSILSLGTLAFLAALMAVASWGLCSGLGPKTSRGVSRQEPDAAEEEGVRLEYRAMFLTKTVRVAFFLRSLAALSCLILLHLLWPDWRTGLETKARRHWAQIEEGFVGRVRGVRVRAREAIGSEGGSYGLRL